VWTIGRQVWGRRVGLAPAYRGDGPPSACPGGPALASRARPTLRVRSPRFSELPRLCPHALAISPGFPDGPSRDRSHGELQGHSASSCSAWSDRLVASNDELGRNPCRSRRTSHRSRTRTPGTWTRGQGPSTFPRSQRADGPVRGRIRPSSATVGLPVVDRQRVNWRPTVGRAAWSGDHRRTRDHVPLAL